VSLGFYDESNTVSTLLVFCFFFEPSSGFSVSFWFSFTFFISSFSAGCLAVEDALLSPPSLDEVG